MCECTDYLTEELAKPVHEMLVKISGECSGAFPGRFGYLFAASERRDLLTAKERPHPLFAVA